MFKIVLADVPPPQSVVPDLDPAFASIISKAMARDLAHRFQSTDDVSRAIDAWLHSGQAVTVPPAAEAAAAGHLPAGARGTMPSSAGLGATPPPGQKTAGTWATSQPGAAALPPKKSAAPVIAAVLGMGLLVVGGGAFAAYSMHNKSVAAAEAASAAQAAPAVPTPSSHALPAPAVAPTPVAVSAFPEPIGPAPAAAARATASVEPSAVAAHPASRPAAAPAAHPAKPGLKPAPADKPAPAPPPKAAGPDFGY